MSLSQISDKKQNPEGHFDRGDRTSIPPAAVAHIAQVAPAAIQAASSTNSVQAPSPTLTQRVSSGAKADLTIEALIQLANNNDPEACYMLFEYYTALHKDRLALDWLDRAANLNYPKALSEKGNMLQMGHKYKKDLARGALYLKRAAEAKMKAAAQSKLQP